MSDDNFNPDELNPDRRFAWELCKMLRDEAFNPLAKEFIKLRERVDKLEAERVNLKYMGTFEDGRQYDPNNFVTQGGSVWCCLERTSSKPGGGNPSWQLAVKAGRDLR
jgi:hypothetical protein